MKITIERLKPEDLEETFAMCMRAFREEHDIAEVRQVYERRKDDPDYYFLVARADGRIAGYTTMALIWDLFDGKAPIATIWYVCVDEKYRRCGIAKALLAEAERIAVEERQSEMLLLTCAEKNTSAHELYRKAGYSDKIDRAFVKYLDEEPAK